VEHFTITSVASTDRSTTHIGQRHDNEYGTDDAGATRELVVKQTEHQGILGLCIMLDRCLKNTKKFPTFPGKVAMQFYYTA
jgi:hypothetical protein